MDNKTLALLGLGAALTAFLSHQSYQNTGSALAWTGLAAKTKKQNKSKNKQGERYE